VALLRDGDVRGEVRFVEEGGGHSRTVLPAVETLLRFAGLKPAELDAYAVALGPGSFTGVRVGISTVQGLALGSGRPALGLGSLDALAAKMRGASATLVPMIDAYRDQVYAAVYDAELRRQRPGQAVSPEAWLAGLPEGTAFLGDGAARYRQTILASSRQAVFPDRSFFLAATLGRLAAPRLAAGEGGDAATLRPLYLRAPDARLPAPRVAPPAR
jgi:tRNA threonylcarbamoyladenosine biosynthesis protein TsaB